MAEWEMSAVILSSKMRTMSRSAALAAYSIQVFEWAVNLTSEVELIHRARWSFIKLAYILCRYCPLLTYPVTLWAYIGDYDQEFCAPIVRPVWALFIPLYLFPHVVMLLRAYAFSGRRKWILVLLSLCFMALCTVTVYAFYTAQVMPTYWYQLSGGKTGCYPSLWPSNILQRLAICIMTATAIDLVSLIVVVVYCLRSSFCRRSRAKHFLAQGPSSIPAKKP
ncbi:hypothetical protein BDN72DRAFT_128912 [Pluteus cervinus]|uniref:Uncharacterized protein n=1 Tax=Pluteus cervinus TaxID=181527 RepID=A0ACD3AMN6_9AGAR|nr:hypothetical protein BDN72DRAFT_128912 [Pluteus cervinus]